MKNKNFRFAAAFLVGCLVCTTAYKGSTENQQNSQPQSLTIKQPSPQELPVGNNIQLTVAPTPSTASLSDLKWSSSAPAIAKVEYGEVTALAVGSATITASVGSVSTTCDINVVEAPPVALEKIEIVPASVVLQEGGTKTLTLKFTPSNAEIDGEPLWESSAPGIAEVDQQGNVTARAIGPATITASVGDVSGTCNITVSDGVMEFTFFQFNIWEGLKNVDNGLDEFIDQLVELEPDAASFCEFPLTVDAENILSRAAEELSTLTGFTYYYNYRQSQGTTGIQDNGTRGLLTRHPIISSGPVNNTQWFYRTVIDFNGREIALYASHAYHSYYACYLPRGYGDGDQSPYGWNKIPSGPITDLDFILEREELSERYKIGEALAADMAAQKSSGRLCIFGGDLNQPSHLDWTEATKNSYEHNGCVVPWSISTICQENNILDAFREVYPDPVTHPGVTWPVKNEAAHKATQWCAEADERDRIDFVYFKEDADIAAVKAQMVGPSAMISHSQPIEDSFVDKAEELIAPVNGLWPSDHRGVLVTFNITLAD